MSDLPERVRIRVEDTINRLDQLRNECNDVQKSYGPKLNEWLRALAGTRLDAMLLDCAEAERCLHDPDVKVRTAALHLLILNWGKTAQFAGTVEQAAFSEEDALLRSTALQLLPNCYYGQSVFARLGKPLARIVRNEKEPIEIRMSAYRALVRLQGVVPKKGLKYVGISFPQDVNWTFIDQLLSSPDER